MTFRTDNSTSPDHCRFDDLVSVLLAGNITVEEHAELDRMLQQHPEFIDEYLQLTGVQSDLRQLSRLGDPPSGVGVGETTRTLSSRATRLSWVGTLSLIAAICVLVATALFTRFSLVTLPVTSPVEDSLAQVDTESLPVIAEVANAKIFGHGLAPQPGEAVPFHQEHILTHGELALEFASGARALLRSPCVFTAVDEQTLVLNSGQCSVYAPPGAEGFRVETPAGKVVDLGTRFVVGVDATGETSLHVVDGAASLTATSEAGTHDMLLRKGESAYLDQQLPPSSTIPHASQVEYAYQLPDRVVRYDATTGSDGLARELLSVTVQRGGRSFTYGRSDLVRARLTHFVAPANSVVFCSLKGDELPAGAKRLELLTDWSLVTGIINPPLNKRGDADVGMEVEFDPPVVNGPGPDIVLFDLQVLVHDEAGDQLTITTRDEGHLGASLSIDRFNLDLSSPNSLDLSPFQIHGTAGDVASVDDLVNGEMQTRRQMHVRAKALATAIDLSNLGYESGESARRIMFQTTEESNYSVDPVLIVGLPDVETAP